jgi:hypothetical protein
MVRVEEIQKKIVGDLQDNFNNCSKDFTLNSVFCNYRTGAGLRVNKNIFNYMKKLYKYYSVDITYPTHITSKNIICLDNTLTMPWYIDYYTSMLNQKDELFPKIHLFGEYDAFLLKIYSGNLNLLN